MTFEDLLLKLGYTQDNFVEAGTKLQQNFSQIFTTVFPKEKSPTIFDGTNFKSTPEDVFAAINTLNIYIKNHPQKAATTIDDRVYKMLKIFSSSNE